LHEQCIVHIVVCQSNEVMSNNEKTLAVIKLCLSQGSQLLNYSVSTRSVTQSVEISVKQFLGFILNVLGLI